jgi:hypothetical protein
MNRVLLICAVILGIALSYNLSKEKKESQIPEEKQVASVGAFPEPIFFYRFQNDGVLEETGLLAESSSPYWWLNSGGRFQLSSGTGKTIEGEVPASSEWYKAYSKTNPKDTDDGNHPQNIFRLLTRNTWLNFDQEVSFKINRIRMSESSNRDESNGVILLHRYVDNNNLYYAGIRVDGHAVIKKKKKGIYYTMGETPVFTGDAVYNKNTNPNLIPGSKWFSLRSEIINNNNDVQITLFIDKGNGFEKVLSVVDDGESYGGETISSQGLAGIRTDFMDVEFDDYKLANKDQTTG